MTEISLIIGVCLPDGIAKCENGGNCRVDTDGNPVCDCAENWIGENCTIGKSYD